MSGPASKASCANCRFARRLSADTDDLGAVDLVPDEWRECHRHAPTPTRLNRFVRWPIVSRDDYCGDGKPRTKGAAVSRTPNSSPDLGATPHLVTQGPRRGHLLAAAEAR